MTGGKRFIWLPLVIVVLWQFTLLPCVAADATAAHPALSPQVSLQQFVVDPGLKVELVAHEPNVIDPTSSGMSTSGFDIPRTGLLGV